MSKLKVLVIFGGMSTEREVSRVSAASILSNMNKEKYEIGTIGIDKDGNFLEYTGSYDNIANHDWKKNTEPILDLVSYIKGFDIAFPILHGLYGEDGTIQGLFELLKIPYVGCSVLSSAICMDKVYTKMILDRAGIKQVPSVYLKELNGEFVLVDNFFNEVKEEEVILGEIEKKLGYPVFVKPSNSGSSVGCGKAKDKDQLISAVKEALKYDKKILIEKAVNPREIECAILQDGNMLKASVLGEIQAASEFYSYEAKYKDENSKLIIPAKLTDKETSYIKETALKAFKAVDAKGLSRVDFFIDKDTDEIYLNEINTLPGFTSVSMYPKLWENTGVEYSTLIDILIQNAKCI